MARLLHCVALLLLFAAVNGDSGPDCGCSPSNSGSVLVALLESPYTEFAELIEKAALLQSLEAQVGRRNITILAPPNSCFEGPTQESFRRFLLEPGNVRLLQRLVEFHVVPRRLTAAKWPSIACAFKTLSSDILSFWTLGNTLKVGYISVVAPDAIVRHDGVVHGVDAFLVPKIVQQAFLLWKKRKFNKKVENSFAQTQAAAGPMGPRRRMSALHLATVTNSKPYDSRDILPLGPGLSLQGDSTVKALLSSLFRYKDYSEMVDLLVNMTPLASELPRLVKEGHRLTVLAPCNEAFAELTEKQLGAPEQTVLYHIITEYQTHNSLYNTVRKLGRVHLETLRFPFKLAAQESNGTVEFGEGNSTARLQFNDIYADGFISVQGIDRLLVPCARKGAEADRWEPHEI